MRIPLNVIHWYIGLPVMLIIAVRSFLVRNRTKNAINTLFGLTAWVLFLCFAAYGIPPLLTDNSDVLTITTIIGDSLQFIGLFFMWVAAARIYFPVNKVGRWILILLDVAVVVAGIAISFHENLSYPVTLMLVNGSWQLDFSFPFGYQVVTAIQFASLPLIAARFWVQSRDFSDGLQKFRVRSMALAFIVLGGVMIARPFLTKLQTTQDFTSTIILAVALVCFGGFSLATFYLSHRKNNRQLS